MEAITIISAIVSLITLIVFFIMAGNISKIRRSLESRTKHLVVLEEAELKEFQDKTEEALDLYMAAHFYLKKYVAADGDEGIEKAVLLKSIEKKIDVLEASGK